MLINKYKVNQIRYLRYDTNKATNNNDHSSSYKLSREMVAVYGSRVVSRAPMINKNDTAAINSGATSEARTMQGVIS